MSKVKKGQQQRFLTFKNCKRDISNTNYYYYYYSNNNGLCLEVLTHNKKIKISLCALVHNIVFSLLIAHSVNYVGFLFRIP